jgi:hypothetical protein
MPQSSSPLLRIGVLGIAMLMIFGCGLTTAVGPGGSTAIPTATSTATPTATPTPGHLVVTIIPNPSICSGTGCNPYVCQNGTTCHIDWTCLSPAWPTLRLSNSGQASLTWNATVTQYNPDGPPWSLSATHGPLAGGASTNVTITNGPGGGMQVVFTGPGQTVTLSITCGVG